MHNINYSLIITHFLCISQTAPNPPRLRVLVVGLDGSGKTAFVECLGKGKKENSMPRPTVGFNIKSVTIGDTLFDIWDGNKPVDLFKNDIWF